MPHNIKGYDPNNHSQQRNHQRVRTLFKDSKGEHHESAKNAEYANQCYAFHDYLNGDVGLDSKNAEVLLTALMSNCPEGKVARDRLRSFCVLTDVHHGKIDPPARWG